MQQSFIDQVVDEIWQSDQNLSDIIFVLPSRRAGTFLKSSIAQKVKRNVFAPQIYSIEQFIEVLANLSYATQTEQLFTLYHAYLKIESHEKERFFSFSKWAPTLLADFDEIDRYLISHKKIFSYLSDITEINHWYLQKERTPLMEDYIKFWNNLEPLYESYKALLLEQGKGHQGLVYRTAHQNLPSYLESTKGVKHVFLGFNALNKAESEIIQHILESTEAEIYWDLDRYFLDEPYHDAGYFIRRHQKQWKYFERHSVKGLSEHYLSPKHIQIIGVPKNVSQAKYLGHLLDQLSAKKPRSLENTALVLGDESLLNPLLNALPPGIDRANITMGYPLKSSPIAGLFTQFFELYLQQDSRGWHHKKILGFISLPYIQNVLSDKDKEACARLRSEAHDKNLIYLTPTRLTSYFGNAPILFFSPNNYDVEGIINNCLALIRLLRDEFENTPDHALEMEQLFCFYTVFNQLKEIIQEFPYIQDIQTLLGLFHEILSQQTIDFQGEPLEGLQIMGMLESRVLDFETVIISSVNEGILPAGKQGNSFIPYDVKKEMGLPTYKEKDAVYTYHFYRLIQRAKNVYLIYNTEPDVLLGGEMSRFLHQLMADQNTTNYVQHKIASMDIHTSAVQPKTIHKDATLFESIRNYAGRGFSPTSLTQYIQDPIEFYKRAILKIEEHPSVEETIAAKTFGTIIHNTLEELLGPFEGQYLDPDHLKARKSKIKEVVKKYFIRFYAETSIHRGKNSIAFQVLLRYIENFMDAEIRMCGQQRIKILALEKELHLDLSIPGIPFPVRLKGKLDRIDEVDGTLRILDYKTGRVTLSDMNLISWEELIRDPDLAKVFQVLCYAFMYANQDEVSSMEAGVLSFKNLNQGFLPFATKEKKGSQIRSPHINSEILDLFKAQLFELIREICNPNIPFTERIN